MPEKTKGNTRKHYRHGFVTLDARMYRDKTLSLKEKGMIGMLFSLPDDWDFSSAGLASILSESKNTVNSVLQSLENNGYLKRTRIYEDGKVADWFYDFYDYPAFPKKDPENKESKKKGDLDPKNEDLGNQDLENEDLENEDLENEDLKNCDGNLYTHESNKQESKNNESIVDDEKEKELFDTERLIAAAAIEIARINEAYRSSDSSEKAVRFIKEICECYGRKQLAIINQFTDEEYRKLFKTAHDLCEGFMASSIINKDAYLSSEIGRFIANHKAGGENE